MNTDQIKPCPCCGGPAGFQHIEEGDNAGAYFIACKTSNCGITTNLRFAFGDDPKPLLREVWNKRNTDGSALEDAAEEIEALNLENHVLRTELRRMRRGAE